MPVRCEELPFHNAVCKVNGGRCEGFLLRASPPAVSWIAVKRHAQAGGENTGVLCSFPARNFGSSGESFAAFREHRCRFRPISPPAVTLVILHQLLIGFLRIRHERSYVR